MIGLSGASRRVLSQPGGFGISKELQLQNIRRSFSYIGIGPLVVGWYVIRCVLDLMGESIDACEAVVDGIFALSSRWRCETEAFNLFLEGFLGQ